LYKGEVSFGEEETHVEEGDMLFIPGGKMVSVTYGNSEKPKPVNNEEFLTHRELYFDLNLDHIDQIKKYNFNMIGINSFQVYKTNIDKNLKNFLNSYNVGISFSEIFYTPPNSKMTIHNDKK